MQLIELTPEEVAFLTASPSLHDDLETRLSRKLAATLTARLRLSASATPAAASAAADAGCPPHWRVDSALSTLWLTRRLGGRHLSGQAPFVPPTLLRTLDAVLAESWLDSAQRRPPPARLAWGIRTDLAEARLVLQLPHDLADMTRWALEVIRHG